MSKKWSSERTIKFLEEYESNPCLWDVSSNDYKNRNLREDAYFNISNAMHIEGFNCAAVKAKIRSIRNAYTLERIKIANSIKSGKGTNEIYKPKVVWFSVADRILHEVVQRRDSHATIIKNKINSQEGTQLQCLNEESLSSPNSPAGNIPKLSSTCRRQTSLIAPKRTKIDKPRKSISNEKTLQELREISNKLETPADDNEFDCFGKTIACQLKKLPERLALESMAYIQSYLVQQRLNGCNSNNQYSMVDHIQQRVPAEHSSST